MCLRVLCAGLIFPVHAQGMGESSKLNEAGELVEEVEIYYQQGRYDEAIPLAKRALLLYENELGPEHINMAAALDRLGWLHIAQGHFSQAEPFLMRGLAIRERVLSGDHPDMARSLHALAVLYDAQGEYARAQSLYERTLVLREKTLGPEHLKVADSLHGLAGVCWMQGRYSRAESLYQRALEIRKRTLGEDHRRVAQTMSDLGGLYRETGDYEHAEPLLKRAVAIQEQTLGREHPDVAKALSNLAALYNERGDYEHAEPLLKRAVAIQEQALGREHLEVAQFLGNLARTYYEQGDYAQAEPLWERSLMTFERALGSSHSDVAKVRRYLAALYYARGDYERADRYLEHALTIQEQALGPNHPEVAWSLSNLALLRWSMGDNDFAFRAWQRNLAIREESLQLLLAIGSEKRKRAYIALVQEETNGVLSFHFQVFPDSSTAARLALETILRRKGRVLDATASMVRSLRRNLDEETHFLLDELSRLRDALAISLLHGPTHDLAIYRSRNKTIRVRIDALEDDLSKRSRRYHEATIPVTVQDVQARIPAQAALVELVLYRPYNPRFHGPRTDRWGAPRYAAYVLHNQDAPRAVDLGEATVLDELVQRWREALQAGQPNASDYARALDARVMTGIRLLLGDNVQHILLAPDGDFNLIPFGALVNEEGKYLIEQYQITYLTSGRDLLRSGEHEAARQKPVVMADPDFGSTEPPPSSSSTRAGDRDLIGLRAPPLPGTAEEAAALAARLANVQTWTGAQATEAQLKALRGPQLLHIATHGFWLEDAKPVSLDDRTRSFTILDAPPSLAVISDPLLRSGLALAGFNKRQSGEDDGFLTALEAASLDLHGTQLVVLSACDTGLGEVESGQGVYGLRRALVVAGAQTLVMSLWKVDDTITRDLMLAYYDRLLAGESRSEALREAQLAMLRDEDTAHPSYWASFLVAGDPSPMTGLVPRPREGVSDWIGRIGIVALALIIIGGIGILALRRRKRALISTLP